MVVKYVTHWLLRRHPSVCAGLGPNPIPVILVQRPLTARAPTTLARDRTGGIQMRAIDRRPAAGRRGITS